MTDTEERIDDLYDRAAETLEMIRSKPDEDDLGPALSHLDDLEDVVDELEDVLSTVDLSDFVDAVEWDDLPDAVELSDLPEAVDEGDASEAVRLGKLLELTDLPELWGSMDAREAWRQKRELGDEWDDLTGEDGPDDAGGDADDDEWVDAEMPDADDHEYDPESIENAIQSNVSDSVGTFREKLLDAHERIAEIRENNQERFPDKRRDHSRNPTAVSTVPQSDSPVGTMAHHSTVPEETRYSSAPNRKRIYGTRFENARGDADE